MSAETPSITSAVRTMSFSGGAGGEAAFNGTAGGVGAANFASVHRARRVQLKHELPACAQGPAPFLEAFANEFLDNQDSKGNTVARIVQVFIADANENLPLGKRLLFKGEEQFTDLTDQELFFEVPIQSLLKEHNALRAVTLDKSATSKSGRDVFLEPVRVRDLKMVVVEVAKF